MRQGRRLLYLTVVIMDGTFNSESDARSPGRDIFADNVRSIRVQDTTYSPHATVSIVPDAELGACLANPCDAGQGCRYTAKSLMCLDCPPGSVSQGVDCVTCQPGQQPTINHTVCEACTANYYSNCGTGSVCQECEGGRVSLKHDQCITAVRFCNPGTYCPSGMSCIRQTDCQLCRTGSVSTGTGGLCQMCTERGPGFVATPDQTKCHKCLPGRQPKTDGSACEACGPGKYSSNTTLTGTGQCADCGTLICQHRAHTVFDVRSRKGTERGRD